MTTSTLDRIAFGKTDIESVLANMNDAQLNQLAFGTVKVDAAGKILKYNAADGALTGRDPKSVIGKNVFKEVAPRTNRPEFKGVFDAGVKEGQLSQLFEYVVDSKMKPPRCRST